MSSRIFDDFAKLVTDATGAAQGVRREVETAIKAQVERMLRDMDVAKREEVDVLKDMVTALREETDRLAARVKVLEGGERAAKPAAPGATLGGSSGPATEPPTI